MGVDTLLSKLLLVNMCGSNGRKLKRTGRNYFSCHACLSRWRTQSIDTAVSKHCSLICMLLNANGCKIIAMMRCC